MEKDRCIDPLQFRPAPALSLAFLIVDGLGDGFARFLDPALSQQGAGKDREIAADPHQKATFDEFVDRRSNIFHRRGSPRKSRRQAAK